jgi:glycosyltransferase involved in cell wall biosynthesis
MKLLIITQRVDLNDDILGFFHRWIEKFAQKLEKLYVICLWQGEYRLPDNVEIFSLGKEKGFSKLRQLFRLQKILLKYLPEVDGVFIHMCPIYAIASFPLVKIFRKKMILWYVHKSVNWELKLAEKLVDKILTASPESCQLKNRKKIEVVGHGIDTEIFKRNEKIQKIKNSILYLGRISPIKNVDILIEAVKLLDKEGIDFVLNIVGEPGEKDKEYFEKIKNLSNDLEEKGKIKFLGKVPNYKTPEIYNQNEILVNLTPSGSFDKAVLEAMACECLVLVANKSFENILPKEFIFNQRDFQDLATKLIWVLKLSLLEKEKYGKDFRKYVMENHNLEKLIQKICKEYEKFN